MIESSQSFQRIQLLPRFSLLDMLVDTPCFKFLPVGKRTGLVPDISTVSINDDLIALRQR